MLHVKNHVIINFCQCNIKILHYEEKHMYSYNNITCIFIYYNYSPSSSFAGSPLGASTNKYVLPPPLGK